ncbi:MAG: asparagine synthase (glutamine-hydrolyzing) [Phycisphaerae bacterium]|nr:asparagine synthase (glutamine-hydrolyzing) [Phycisphaerae bacterium]
MCGIAGILKVHPPGTPPPPPEVAIPESWLDVLDESIKHRGPDGQGRFRDRATRPDGSVVDVAFVHRRLAIIDLADGQQPMVSERGPGYPDRERSHRVAVVFNGCVYNHRELRRELENAGHEFVTDHSDTEVLIHGWREWGRNLFARLDGMFAVAIWDSQTGWLTTTRDRFGEKPLYAYCGAGTEVFGSSIAGVFRLKTTMELEGPLQRHSVQSAAAAAWLRFGWSTSPPLGRVAQTARGFSFQSPVDSDSKRVGFKNPWDLSLRRTPRQTFIQTDEVDRLLEAAVRSRLEADVPLAVFLSGGLDSALIASHTRAASSGCTAFTVRMPVPEIDESAAAVQTAAAIGIRHEILDCNADPARDLLHLVRELGLPFGDSSLLPAYWVSRTARAEFKVALSGDGGDELFLGYERHRALSPLWYGARIPKGILRSLSRVLGGPAAIHKTMRKVARLADAAAGASFLDLLAIFPRSEFSHLVDADADRIDKRFAIDVGALGAVDSREQFQDSALTADLNGYLPEDLLRKTDAASMSVALEVRAPFLARELVDRMIRVRPDVLMPDGERKGLLKAVARKYLPDEIVNRPKMGFSIPIGEWFRSDYGGMKQLLLDTLNSADPFPEDLLGFKINRAFVAKMIADHMDRKLDHSQRLYMLLVLAIWSDWLRTLNRN